MICVTESYLDDTVIDTQVLNNDYAYFRRDCCLADNVKLDGGGCCIKITANHVMTMTMK